MTEGASVTGSIRAKLVRRFAAVAVGAVLVACSTGYAILWVWSGQVGQDRAMRLPAVLDGASPQSTASAHLSERIDAFLFERIADVRAWASAPAVLHATRQANVLHDESGLLDLASQALDDKLQARAGLAQFPIAGGYVRSESARSEHFDWIRFNDRNGLDIVVAQERPSMVSLYEAWWQRAWSDGAAIGDVTYAEAEDRWTIDISVRIDEPATGMPVGVLQAGLNIASIQNLTDRFKERGYAEQVTVAGPDGLLIAETASEHSSARIMNEKVGLRGKDIDVRRAAFEGDRSGRAFEGGWIVEYSRTAGGEYYAEAIRGSQFPGFDWVVIVQRGQFEAFSGADTMFEKVGAWRRSHAGIFGVGFLVISLLAFGIVWWMAARVSRPVRYLRAAAMQMSEGRMTGAVQLETNDELSEIADALERMRRTMQAAMRVLRDRGRGSAA